MMNYEPNTIAWQPGDLVIHDADGKQARMLMRVLEPVDPNGDCHTEYLDRSLRKTLRDMQPRLCQLAHLHDPARFGIDVSETIPSVHAEMASLRAEVVRLRDLLSDPSEITTKLNKSGAEITIEHWACKLIADSFAKSLGDANFITMEVGPLPHPDGGQICVTVQRKHGKSPAQVIGELKAELAALKAQIESRDEEAKNDQLEWLANSP
jgi:hypothetical protein